MVCGLSTLKYDSAAGPEEKEAQHLLPDAFVISRFKVDRVISSKIMAGFGELECHQVAAEPYWVLFEIGIIGEQLMQNQVQFRYHSCCRVDQFRKIIEVAEWPVLSHHASQKMPIE
jgi:hypothetical protein